MSTSISLLQYLLQMFGVSQEASKNMSKRSSNSPTIASKAPRKIGHKVSGTSVIGVGTVIDGEIKSDNNIRLDGTVIGNIECSAKVVMGKRGSFKGNMITDSTIIEGNFEGHIEVKDLMHLQSTALVQGEILASKLIVDIGAVLTGTYEITGIK